MQSVVYFRKNIFWNHTVVFYRIQMFLCLRRSNPLTSTAFCQKCILWTFWRFSGWIWAKFAPIISKRHLQHDCMPFFPLLLRFTTFFTLAWLEIKILRSDLLLTWGFLFFFMFCFFGFPFSPFFIFFAVVIDLPLGLLLIQKLPRKHH